MGRVERNFVGPWVRLACFLVDTLSLFSPYPSCLSNEPIPFRPSIRHGDRHAAELLLRHARRRQEGLLFVLRLPRLRHVAALRSLPLRRRRHFNRRGPAPQEAVPAHRRAYVFDLLCFVSFYSSVSLPTNESSAGRAAPFFSANRFS